jgi:hypothetical protein
MFKFGFITNWIITLQILSLCLSQVNMEFCIKFGCKVVTSGWQGFFGIKYYKICVEILAKFFKSPTNLQTPRSWSQTNRNKGSGVAVDNKEETCIEMFHLVFVIILSILDLVWR